MELIKLKILINYKIIFSKLITMNYLIKKMLFSAILLAFIANVELYAQNVTGTITDNQSKAISGADVRLKGALKVSATSDAAGKFSINVPENSTKVLLISAKGYDEVELSVAGKTNVDVVMTSSVRINQYGQAVNRIDINTEARNGILVFESENKEYKLWFDNRIYFDGAHYFDNYDHSMTADENLAEGRMDIPDQLLKLRRMRFAIKANIGNNWYGEIDFDFDGNVVDIKDVYLRKYLGQTGSIWGQVRIGQFRMPQGMQTTTTSRYLKLIERASVGEFNPGRKIGIGWNSWSNNYTVGLAVHTEETRNVHDQLEGDAYYFKGEMQGAKPMLGVSSKAAYYIMNEPGKLVSVAAGYSARTPGLYKFPDNRIKYDPKDETNVSELEWTVAKVGGVELAHNLNFESAVSFGQWRMTGEYYLNKLDMLSGSDPVNFSGFYIQSSYVIFGAENHPWNHKEAEFTQLNRDEKGAVEVVGRYSYINLNDFDQGVRGGQKGQYTFGVNYYAAANVKFMLNFSYVDHDMYSTGTGDYADWVNQDPAIGETSGFDYGFISWRCEIDF